MKNTAGVRNASGQIVVSYCGLAFDMSAYSNAKEFASAVWDAVFHSRDSVDSTANAIRWANERQERAFHDWKSFH